jgi:hypothetical protein
LRTLSYLSGIFPKAHRMIFSAMSPDEDNDNKIITNDNNNNKPT